MLTAEQNRLLCRIEGDAPMGALMKRYWVPACLSDEVLKPGGAPVRTRVLGVDMVVFRSPDGTLGAVYEYCSHRGVSLSLARNEDCGLRCLYHGWKVDREGRIIDMPTEAPDSRAREHVRHDAYPVEDSGGLIWVYLGPRATMPRFEPMTWASLPAAHRVICRMEADANWAQVFEGQIDSAHSSMLHSTEIRTQGDTQAAAATTIDVRPSGDPNPRLRTTRVPYGMRYVAIRKPTRNADTHDYMRVTAFIAPFTALIPPNNDNYLGNLAVPRDDGKTAVYFVHFSPKNPIDYDAFAEVLGVRPGIDYDSVTGQRTRTRANNFLQDREAMARGNFSGITGIGPQDIAMWESMGPTPIIDRTREHLGSTDVAVVQFRRIMLDAVERFQQTGWVLGQDGSPVPHGKINAFAGVMPKEASWETLGLCEEEMAFVGKASAEAAE